MTKIPRILISRFLCRIRGSGTPDYLSTSSNTERLAVMGGLPACISSRLVPMSLNEMLSESMLFLWFIGWDRRERGGRREDTRRRCGWGGDAHSAVAAERI